MQIINYDCDVKEKNKHSFLLPNSFRCIICGPSGCGKTNLLMNILINKDVLNYHKLRVYSKSIHQDKYRILQDWAEELGEDRVRLSTSDLDDVESVDPQFATVAVFDDVMLENQDLMKKYFSQGRHHNIDCIYLCQSYFQVPKQGVRENANLLVLFKQDKKNLQHIFSSHCSGDMSFDEFIRFFREATNEPFSFAVIDLTSPPYNGKYRKRFDEFYKM